METLLQLNTARTDDMITNRHKHNASPCPRGYSPQKGLNYGSTMSSGGKAVRKRTARKDNGKASSKKKLLEPQVSNAEQDDPVSKLRSITLAAFSSNMLSQLERSLLTVRVLRHAKSAASAEYYSH